ncbi:exosome complex exonuclease RRP6, putative [Plasmodium ovale]|uniref:3'-5' exonuclease domain containing protein n=2 Tax=Plasmodium ovale TaxID=36330 RepID=A0A1A8WYW3_PLAOA|nr:3'-5' exonuclease domain containing protein [Plasmodium ovale curtisi]SBS97079.1 3'-5' exonuclease domain containing protein [Plasmodium ovale curtisi]SCP05786.1 exosome complex exonuclease RRP6, putative [Plasmodium ovale]
MEHCGRKIDELLRAKSLLCDLEKNEEKNYVMKKLLNNVVEIVKLTNRLSFSCLYKNDINIITNKGELSNLKNSLLKIVYDLLLYSSNDKTKNLIKSEFKNNHCIIPNNYYIISSTLDEIYTRAKKCYPFFNQSSKDNSIIAHKIGSTSHALYLNDGYNKKNAHLNHYISPEHVSQGGNKEISNEQRREKKVHSNLPSMHIKKEETNSESYGEDTEANRGNGNETSSAEKQDGDEDEESINFQKLLSTHILKVQSDSEESDKHSNTKNDYKNVKKDLDKNTKKGILSSRENKRKKGKKKKSALEREALNKRKNAQDIVNKDFRMAYISPKKISQKVQSSWLHLTNNYAKYFIPRIPIKYNKMMELEGELAEAIQFQERLIEKKKKLLYYWEMFYCNALDDRSSNKIIEEMYTDIQFKDMDAISDISEISQVHDVEKMTKKEKINEINEINLNIKKDLSKCKKDAREEKSCSYSCSSSDVTMPNPEESLSEDFFCTILKKLNKDINKYSYKINNLNHPYTYEITNIIKLYSQFDESVSTFANVKDILTKPEDINNKEYIIVKDKQEFIEMVNLIQTRYNKISMTVLVNYKNTYRGFTSLILIGTMDKNYLIDVLDIFEEVYLLNKITTDQRILKIMHRAENVVLPLQKDFSIYFVNIIDISLCADCLNLKNNLSYLVYNYFNVTVHSSGHDSNFLARPLTPDLVQTLKYSFHYLYYLFDYVITDLYFNFIVNSYRGRESASVEGVGTEGESGVAESRGYSALDIDGEDHIERRGKNIYVNFEKIKFSDISENERKYGEKMINRVFVHSNRKCLTKYEIRDVCDVRKTLEQIKTIIRTSYNSKFSDTLIEDILVWREKLSKKYDESPDSIINIHNIISIIINMPTTLSSLKNNIVPLSTTLAENLETLFEIVIKSNVIKKTNLFFYRNYTHCENHIGITGRGNEEETLNSATRHVYNRENINTENYKNVIIAPNMYFQCISEEESFQKKEKVVVERDQRETNEGEQQKEMCTNMDEEIFALEKTFFGEKDDNLMKGKGRYNSYSNDDSATLENYLRLSSLISSMKERKEKVFNARRHTNPTENAKTEGSKTKKSIVKDKKQQNKGENKNRVMYQSYNQQYNIKKTKELYSKNILNEMS